MAASSATSSPPTFFSPKTAKTSFSPTTTTYNNTSSFHKITSSRTLSTQRRRMCCLISISSRPMCGELGALWWRCWRASNRGIKRLWLVRRLFRIWKPWEGPPCRRGCLKSVGTFWRSAFRLIIIGGHSWRAYCIMSLLRWMPERTRKCQKALRKSFMKDKTHQYNKSAATNSKSTSLTPPLNSPNKHQQVTRNKSASRPPSALSYPYYRALRSCRWKKLVEIQFL